MQDAHLTTQSIALDKFFKKKIKKILDNSITWCYNNAMSVELSFLFGPLPICWTTIRIENGK